MFSSLLPKPKYSEYNEDADIRLKVPNKKSPLKSLIKIADKESSSPSIIETPTNAGTISKYYLNEDGTLNYNLTIASNAFSGNRKVQASYEDTIPLKVKYPNLKHHFPRYNLDSCPDDSLSTCVKETKEVIDQILMGDSSKQGTRINDTSYVKYSTNSINSDDNDHERGRERILQIKNYQEDPMLLPKFKLRKNRHKATSPPPPILRSTTKEKLTKEDKEKWNIPAAISNWSNNQRFAISIDKRMLAANGGSLSGTQERDLERFSALSEALETADKKAREEIIIRKDMMEQMVKKDRIEKENKLRELAEFTRKERETRPKRELEGSNQKSVKKKKILNKFIL